MAIALPNFLRQVSKSKQAEAKTNLAALSCAQQVYYLEESSFANNINLLPVQVSWKYYNITYFWGFPKWAFIGVDPKTTYVDIPSHSAAISINMQGQYMAIICRANYDNIVTSNVLINIDTTTMGLSCSDVGQQIK